MKRPLLALPFALLLLNACGSDSGPSGPPSIVGAVIVSAGSEGTCAIGTSGGLACWGAVPDGIADDTTASGADVLGALPVNTPTDLIALNLNRDLTGNSGCAVGSDHQAYCWGTLLESDVGHSMGAGITATTGLTSLASIATSRHVICGTRTDNGVRCIGWYTGGGRGIDSLPNPDNFDLTPNPLKPAIEAFGTSLGLETGCALKTDSTAACWGVRFNGQLGGATGDTLQNCGNESPAWCQPGPAPVAGGHKYRQVSVDLDHACATLISGGVECWGRKVGVTTTNLFGTPCAPADACLYTPTAVTLPAPAIRVGVGAEHACALVNTGDVYCWGDNTNGQLGRPGASSLTPVKVSGGYIFVGLTVGSAHSCAIEAGTGAVGCWGANASGQLGDGTTTDRDHPVAVVVAE